VAAKAPKPGKFAKFHSTKIYPEYPFLLPLAATIYNNIIISIG
jgi:hypothetical protein